MDNKKLIRLVAENTCLWNMHHSNYHNRDEARQKWEHIAQQMNVSCEVVKNKWRGLRDTYRKEWKKVRKYNKNPGTTKPPSWCYFKDMAFLKSQVSQSKFNQPQTDGEASEEDEDEIEISETRIEIIDEESPIAVALSTMNAPQLIDEVKKRPCLYDNDNRGKQEARTEAWNEIGEAMFKEWSKCSREQKENAVREMQTKWKSIRDTFARYQFKTLPESTKKCLYMDQLSFLASYTQKRDKSQAALDDSSDPLFIGDNPQPTRTVTPVSAVPVSTVPTNTIPVNTIPVTNQSVQFVPIQPKRAFATRTIGTIDLSSLNVEPPMKRMAKSLEELVSIQKSEKKDDPMDNRKFLLSLLPFMRNLPDDVNLEVRLQLMSVLQTYTNRKGFQT
ncbi:hypothetical protein GWI33_022155 [Rhynchophorus ferrugineus]|uniref:Uncharacterized protein n=1 Tax=Rhynchophorus ferrugineus TaxID=354439 RepID=A0A834J0K9_RHYFE|nr:hypothetical protein GWI33_022155 [Rhynchophorus ferrugineus]